MSKVCLLGAPIDAGQRRAGCIMGPAAYRVAGIVEAIRELGHAVSDWGDLALPALTGATCAGCGTMALPRWTCRIWRAGCPPDSDFVAQSFDRSQGRALIQRAEIRSAVAPRPHGNP